MVRDARGVEGLISRILTWGALLSILLLSAGMALYALQTRGLTLTLDDGWVLRGNNILEVAGVILAAFSQNGAYALMASGILMLMLTQYLRVIASSAYFSIVGDWKYVAITLAVLAILTLSLTGLTNF